MANEKHLIFGTGPLGLSVMRALHQQGKSVQMVNRSGKADVPQGVTVIASDAYNPDQVAKVSAGATVVYQCAQPGYTEWQAKFPPLQTSILQGVMRSGAKLVVGENLYLYGEVDGLIHEQLPYLAHTKKGRVRAQMARELEQAQQSGKIQIAMARGSDFYGAGVLGSSIGEMVFGALLQGKAVTAIGNIDLPHSMTYIDDFGKAMALLGNDAEAVGAWHVPNAPVITTREYLAMIGKEAGITPKINVMGKLMMRIGGLFIPEAKEGVEMMYEFVKPFVVDDSKFKARYGDIATPFQTGIQQTLAWYKQHLSETVKH